MWNNGVAIKDARLFKKLQNNIINNASSKLPGLQKRKP